MTAAHAWRIPPSVSRHLDGTPADRPVALLLRHSVRDALPDGDAAYTLPITDIGQQLARDLGAAMGPRLRTVHTSPLTRCVQTAESLRLGAGRDLAVRTDRLLGDPGAYVIDGRRAWPNWQTLGHAGVMAQLVSSSDALPGMARPDPAARFLVQHMLAVADDSPGLHVFVTHDSLVTATAARLLGVPLGQDAWPWYLEGAFFWRTSAGLHVAYRDHEALLDGTPLCPLDETNIIEFARREVAATVGLDSGARFFLAGGAFKTLLTGRPPRDLDLWAPSEQDRTALLSALQSRGAQPLAPRPFADAFHIADRIVEVPHRTDPPTLQERIARFDLALSAIGVEHRPGDDWSAFIHPLALEALARRQVLLLRPLVNWKYALTTLERMRRYAAELGFTASLDDEAEVWSTFLSQPDDMRAGMLERFTRTALGGFDVLEEATCRLL